MNLPILLFVILIGTVVGWKTGDGSAKVAAVGLAMTATGIAGAEILYAVFGKPETMILAGLGSGGLILLKYVGGFLLGWAVAGAPAKPVRS